MRLAISRLTFLYVAPELHTIVTAEINVSMKRLMKMLLKTFVKTIMKMFHKSFSLNHDQNVTYFCL